VLQKASEKKNRLGMTQGYTPEFAIKEKETDLESHASLK
jgi:hypothetical protein